MKVDRVLVAAEVLLQNGDDETKSRTHAKLKELKSMWEETSTYIIHCHRYCSLLIQSLENYAF